MPFIPVSEIKTAENLQLDRSSSIGTQSDSKVCDIEVGIEGARCEAVHEAINKFVVYEKFAEMTHKYDV